MTTLLVPEDQAVDQPHISASELAAFVDRTLAPKQRAIIAAHLADCAECRAELVSATTAIASHGRGANRRRRTWTLGAVAAAAALLVVVVLPRADFATDPASGVERRAVERAGMLVTTAPEDGAVLETDNVTLSWLGEEGSSYRVTVTDDGGTTLWSALTSDASVAVPAGVLAPAGRHYWYVDALRADGSSASSGARTFSTGSR